MSTIRHKTIIGTVWNFSEQLFNRGLNVLITIMLAWFLLPKEYGLIAMMAVFLALSSALIDAGFSQALIRKQDVSSQDYSTAFYANIILSVLIYLTLYGCAPFISRFYSQPLLVELIRVSGLTLFFNALSIVQKTVLIREMKFKLQLKVSLPASLLSGGLAIYSAYVGFGVWSLIIQMITNALFSALFYWRLNLWRPSITFSVNSLKELFGFGGYLLLESISAIPFRNMYVIVIAKIFSANIAGLYFFADKIKEIMMTQFVLSIQNVTYPALAKVQDDDERLKSGFRKIISVTTYLMSPAMIFLASLAEPLFTSILPDKWFGSVEYLQLMCLASVFNPLNTINLNILKVKGRSDIVFYIGLYKKTVAIGIFIYSLQFGIIAILLGQIINSVLAYLPNSYFSSRLIHYSMKEQAVDFVPSLILSAMIALMVYGLQAWVQWPATMELIIFSLIALSLYILISHILKLKAYLLIKDLIQNKIK